MRLVRNRAEKSNDSPVRHSAVQVNPMFVQHERTPTGESPQTALIVGRLQPKARVSAVRRNLKEAGGKHLV